MPECDCPPRAPPRFCAVCQGHVHTRLSDNESPCLRCCPGGLQCHLTLFVLAQCQALWDRVRGQERWGKAWALQALAAVQRLELSLGAFADSLYSLTQVGYWGFLILC